MANHNTKLIKKEAVAERTLALHLEKPEGLSFEAGQAIEVSVPGIEEPDGHGASRELSIASAPHERDIIVAARIRESAAKQALSNLPEGAVLSFEGPFGDFTLHENTARPAVILAGGIGITPFRSMILDALGRNLPHRIYLFYSNRRPEDAPFLDELMALAEKHEQLTVVPTMTGLDEAKGDWSGERGYITMEMLGKYVEQDANPLYYIAGPQEMVLAMREMLTKNGVSKDDIRSEEFSGY